MNVGPASTVDVDDMVDVEPSPSPKSVEGAAGGVVGAAWEVLLLKLELMVEVVSLGNAVLDSVGSGGKVELASGV